MLTLQDVFEECANHLLNQNKVAKESNGLNCYSIIEEDEDGEPRCLMCAAGPLLQINQLDAWTNTTSFDELCDCHPELLRPDVYESFYNPFTEEVDSTFEKMVTELQRIHDYEIPASWLVWLQRTAESFGLSLYFLKQRAEG